MKKLLTVALGTLAAGTALAENVAGVSRLICAAGQAQICLETDECFTVMPAELSVPEFVVVDMAKRTVATTRASGEARSTEFSKVDKLDGLLYFQGMEDGRAFSFVIHEATGRLTVAVSRDGLTVSVFGACTDASI